MPKRPYPFDYYSHNSQQKYYLPDKEYLTTVYDKTIRRLFEASKSPSTPNMSTISTNQKSHIKKTETFNNPSTPSCNQCFDTDLKTLKMKCEFCEKSNCVKCLKCCYRCSYNYCSNCITTSYTISNNDEYVCHSCVNKRISI